MAYLQLTRDQIQVMIQDARDGRPDEVCGLLAGTGHTVQAVLPVPNRAHEPHKHFYMDEMSLLKALRYIDAKGWALLGMYHSHPESEFIPSQEDVEAARQHYPNLAQVIISLKREKPRLKAWRIQPGQVEAIEILIDEQQPGMSREEKLSRVQRYAIVLVALMASIMMIGLSFALLPPAPVITPSAR